jgi:hypothetical protein
MPGQYLRTNYRITGGKLDAIALGEGFIKGSWAAGAGVNIGPIVMGSYSGTAATYGSTTGVISIEAGSALASFYGCDKVGDGSGYRIYPFIIQQRAELANSLAGLNLGILKGSLSTSVGASQMLIWLGGSVYSTYGCDWSAHFNWVGLVVSTP